MVISKFFLQILKQFRLGGGSRLAEFSDIWAVSIQKSSEPIWKQLPLKEEKAKLPARIGMAYTKVDSQIFIHGGQNFNENKHFDEFFKLNLGSFPFIIFINANRNFGNEANKNCR